MWYFWQAYFLFLSFKKVWVSVQFFLQKFTVSVVHSKTIHVYRRNFLQETRTMTYSCNNDQCQSDTLVPDMPCPFPSMHKQNTCNQFIKPCLGYTCKFFFFIKSSRNASRKVYCWVLSFSCSHDIVTPFNKPVDISCL